MPLHSFSVFLMLSRDIWYPWVQRLHTIKILFIDLKGMSTTYWCINPSYNSCFKSNRIIVDPLLLSCRITRAMWWWQEVSMSNLFSPRPILTCEPSLKLYKDKSRGWISQEKPTKLPWYWLRSSPSRKVWQDTASSWEKCTEVMTIRSWKPGSLERNLSPKNCKKVTSHFGFMYHLLNDIIVGWCLRKKTNVNTPDKQKSEHIVRHDTLF